MLPTLQCSATESSTLAPDNEIERLAATQKWKALLHYRPQGWLGRESSEVDDPAFFLSSEGHYDPLLELLATIELFKTGDVSSDARACQFPARFAFLKQQLPNFKWHTPSCPTFDEWLADVKGDTLSLIFPASYMNSPSSMFGHTLLKLDGEQGHTLLSSAINFAAFTDPSDDEITFTIKGLTGGYPGYVSLMPYYEKVNEYNHIESRDIWEYELNLTAEEIHDFILHVWELNEIRFDYFFIDENCSYRLLTILDAVNPKWQLSDGFDSHTVPTDTVRRLNDAGLLGDVNFRPSSSTILNDHRDSMSPLQRAMSVSLAHNPNALTLDERYQRLNLKEKAQVLEAAYEFNRYLSVKKKVRDPQLHQRSLQLLSMRAKVGYTGSAFEDVETPEIRDDEGHHTFRSMIGFGETGDESFLQYSARINYHDLLDNLPGYRSGAQIEMGQLSIRAVEGDLYLSKFDVLHIRSLGERNEFNQPLSWQVKAGYEKEMANSPALNYLKTGGGLSYGMFGGLGFGLINGALNYSAAFKHHWLWQAGAELGWSYQTDDVNGLVSYSNLKGVDQDVDTEAVSVGVSYGWSPHRQLRLDWQGTRETVYGVDNESTQVKVSYVIYH